MEAVTELLIPQAIYRRQEWAYFAGLSLGQRRLAAIMYTDMVGYTALGQRNEELSLAAVEAQKNVLEPVFSRHGGRTVKVMGDAFLVEFTNALEAVRCAYDIQRSVKEYNLALPKDRKFRLRVGIHLGDVVETQGDILGDAVNVASRIEPLAEEGGVCLTQQVYDHVHSKIDIPLVSVGKRSLKNVSGQIEVYKMVMPWDEGEAVSPWVQKLVQPDPHRIAVLPVVNISPNPNDAYFADGLTEELISRLSKISKLNVISRTSIMRFRGSAKPAAEIGAELAVSAILEGSVRKAGEKLRITAKLIDTQSDKHLWSETYDRELKDIFDVQADIATKIAGSLRLALLKEDEEKITKKPTDNMRAYSLYLKGKHFWNERSEESVRKGIGYLEQAIKEDPDFAMAYSDLAVAYGMTDYAMVPTERHHAEIIKNATKALEMDPSLSDAHAALGLAYEADYQFKLAEEEYVKALDLDQKNTNARHWYAMTLYVTGKRKRAISEWKKAIELDPYHLPSRCSLGACLALSGDKNEGLEMAKSGVELDDSSLYAHVLLGNVYVVNGMIDKVAEEAKIISRLAGQHDFSYRAQAGCLYALSGNIEEARKIQKNLIEESSRRYVDPCFLGMMFAALGDQSNALEQLEKAVLLKSGWARLVTTFPSWKSIQQNPRFLDIIEHLGIR